MQKSSQLNSTPALWTGWASKANIAGRTGADILKPGVEVDQGHGQRCIYNHSISKKKGLFLGGRFLESMHLECYFRHRDFNVTFWRISKKNLLCVRVAGGGSCKSSFLLLQLLCGGGRKWEANYLIMHRHFTVTQPAPLYVSLNTTHNNAEESSISTL